MMEIRHNFYINTRVRKAGVFFLKTNQKEQNASNDTTLYPKNAPGAIQNVSTQEEKDSLVRKDFPTSCHCVSQLPPSCQLSQAWKQHGSESRNKDGTAGALFTLSNVEGKGEAVIAPDTPNATLFFMPLFEQENPHNSTDTTMSVPSAVW